MEREIILKGNTIKYNLILKNKKNISIKIDFNGSIIVYSPIGIDMIFIEKLLVKNQEWILNNISKMKKINNEDNKKIIFLGKDFFIKIENCENEKIYIDKDVIIIRTKVTSNKYVKKMLSSWYKEQANVIIKKRVEMLSVKCNLFPSKIIIKNQKSIWGSCNTKKEVRLNWRLILMPKFVMDYIIIHELCHIKYMNHSKEFWDLVSYYKHNYKEAKEWLKENGFNIMRID